MLFSLSLFLSECECALLSILINKNFVPQINSIKRTLVFGLAMQITQMFPPIWDTTQKFTRISVVSALIQPSGACKRRFALCFCSIHIDWGSLFATRDEDWKDRLHKNVWKMAGQVESLSVEKRNSFFSLANIEVQFKRRFYFIITSNVHNIIFRSDLPSRLPKFSPCAQNANPLSTYFMCLGLWVANGRILLDRYVTICEYIWVFL